MGLRRQVLITVTLGSWTVPVYFWSRNVQDYQFVLFHGMVMLRTARYYNGPIYLRNNFWLDPGIEFTTSRLRAPLLKPTDVHSLTKAFCNDSNVHSPALLECNVNSNSLISSDQLVGSLLTLRFSMPFATGHHSNILGPRCPAVQ